MKRKERRENERNLKKIELLDRRDKNRIDRINKYFENNYPLQYASKYNEFTGLKLIESK